MEALGFKDHKGHKGGFGSGPFETLTEEQRDALFTAKKANDEETVKAILKEAGIDEAELKARHESRHRNK
jgi:2-hydroxychromene-2-carboxylate isomerase